MPKILFPTDFSPNAKNAFIYAVNLAKKIGAEITTIHVYEKPKIPGIERMPVTGEEIYEGIKSEIFEEYRQQIPGYREIAEEMQASNITIKHELKEGEIIRTICRYAYEIEADFIIMGTKGASGLKEMFLGSFTSEIMEKSPCPVLGVPEKARLNKVDKIGVTYNFAKDTPALIDTTLTVSRIFGAETHCLHVDTSNDPELAKKEAELKALFKEKHRIKCVILDGSNIETAIMDYATENGIDILTMVTTKRSFFQGLFHYSIAKKLAFHMDIPILALPVSTLTWEAS